MLLDPGNWLADRGLPSLRVADEGILVLSIRTRDGKFHGTPPGDDIIRASDTLILYGHIENIEKPGGRRASYSGDKEQTEAAEEQEEFEESTRLEREAGPSK